MFYNKLQNHRQVWQDKAIIRIIYSEWYAMIISDLKPGNGKTIELGAGGGNFKEFYPPAIASDIDPQPWLDMVFDAHQMPFPNQTIANLVLIDTLHHLADPLAFFAEADRVLEPGGRIIMLEPYPSFFSSIIYRLFHPEPFIMTADYFSINNSAQKHPWDSNQAIPYLLFFKHLSRWQDKFAKTMTILKRNKLSCILYPLSGGFEHAAFIPDRAIPFFQTIEKVLTPLTPLLAFRCYLVLQKNPSATD